jgi:galactokinase/mevalonate kinase-like predicted kinase
MSIGNTIVVRIPAQNFDSVINTLEGEAEKFESKTINTDDVTEEFIDIQKRLENKKKVEEQYLEYLKQAHTIPDILEVNEHIRVIREEIDAKEGRLKYLSNQVGFSTITLYIHQDFNTVSYGFFHKVGEALGGGWDGFLMFIVGLIYLWPLLLLITVLILIIRRIIKKRKTKSAKTE